MVALIFWLLIIFALLFLCCLSTALTLVLKAKARRIAADTTLVMATVLVASTIACGEFSKDYVNTKKPDLTKTDYVKECDLAANGLTEASYTDNLQMPLKLVVIPSGDKAFNNALAGVEKQVQAIAARYPGNAAVTARLAILAHRRGNSVRPVFIDYDKEHGPPSALIETLKELYSKPVEAHAARYEQSVQSGLTREWYRQQALKDIYGALNPIKLKQAQAEEDTVSSNWARKLGAYYLALICLVITTPLVVVWLRQWRAQPGEVLPLATSFRRAYACMLILFVAQLVAGLGAGIIIGLSSTLYHAKVDHDLYQFLSTTPPAAAGALAVLTLFYCYVCRQKKISLLQAFTWGSIRLNLLSVAALCVGGFACAVTLNLLARLLIKLIPGNMHVPTAVQKTIIDSIFTGNSPLIMSMLFVACVVAPLAEELVFRLLIYGWLRSRTGIVPSIIFSSLAFAAWHFDMSGFWQYFAIGVVLAAVYERTRNLFIVIAIHGLWNFWVMFTISWLMVH